MEWCFFYALPFAFTTHFVCFLFFYFSQCLRTACAVYGHLQHHICRKYYKFLSQKLRQDFAAEALQSSYQSRKRAASSNPPLQSITLTFSNSYFLFYQICFAGSKRLLSDAQKFMRHHCCYLMFKHNLYDIRKKIPAVKCAQWG